MKKSRVIFLAIAVVLVALVISAVVPKTPFSEIENCDIHYVIAYTSDAGAMDITQQVDKEDLKSLFQEVQCKRYRKQFAPYQTTETTYEITGLYEGEVFHMVLDEAMGFIYESADLGGHEITNKPLKAEILEFLSQQR